MLQENRKLQILLIYFVFFFFSGLVKLWSALTLLGFYQNRRCAFRVLQVKPCGAGWIPLDVISGSKLGRLPKPYCLSIERWPRCKNALVWYFSFRTWFQCRCLSSSHLKMSLVQCDSSGCLIALWFQSKDKS